MEVIPAICCELVRDLKYLTKTKRVKWRLDHDAAPVVEHHQTLQVGYAAEVPRADETGLHRFDLLRTWKPDGTVDRVTLGADGAFVMECTPPREWWHLVSELWELWECAVGIFPGFAELSDAQCTAVETAGRRLLALAAGKEDRMNSDSATGSRWIRVRRFSPTGDGRGTVVEVHKPCDVWIDANELEYQCESCGQAIHPLRCEFCCWLSHAGYWMSPPRCTNPDRTGNEECPDSAAPACSEYSEATTCAACGGPMVIASVRDRPEGQERLWYCVACARSRQTVMGDL